MAKAHRGRDLRKLPHRGRGTCPICGATGIKLLYDRTTKDGTKIKVCKHCRHKSF